MQPDRPLTDRQERFIHEYMIDQNARQAALRCGYAPSSCAQQASVMMKDPRVKARVREGLDALFERLDITAERVLGERARAAFFDPLSLVDAQGQPVPLNELGPEVKSALVISYQTRNGVPVLRVRHVNRNPALAVLERRLAQLEELRREQAEAEAEARIEQAQAEETARQVAAFEERMAAMRKARAPEPQPTAPRPLARQAEAAQTPAAMAQPLAAAPLPRTEAEPKAERSAREEERWRPILPQVNYGPAPDWPKPTFPEPGYRVPAPLPRERARFAITEDEDDPFRD